MSLLAGALLAAPQVNVGALFTTTRLPSSVFGFFAQASVANCWEALAAFHRPRSADGQLHCGYDGLSYSCLTVLAVQQRIKLAPEACSGA